MIMIELHITIPKYIGIDDIDEHLPTTSGSYASVVDNEARTFEISYRSDEAYEVRMDGESLGIFIPSDIYNCLIHHGEF